MTLPINPSQQGGDGGSGFNSVSAPVSIVHPVRNLGDEDWVNVNPLDTTPLSPVLTHVTPDVYSNGEILSFIHDEVLQVWAQRGRTARNIRTSRPHINTQIQDLPNGSRVQYWKQPDVRTLSTASSSNILTENDAYGLNAYYFCHVPAQNSPNNHEGFHVLSTSDTQRRDRPTAVNLDAHRVVGGRPQLPGDPSHYENEDTHLPLEWVVIEDPGNIFSAGLHFAFVGVVYSVGSSELEFINTDHNPPIIDTVSFGDQRWFLCQSMVQFVRLQGGRRVYEYRSSSMDFGTQIGERSIGLPDGYGILPFNVLPWVLR